MRNSGLFFDDSGSPAQNDNFGDYDQNFFQLYEDDLGFTEDFIELFECNEKNDSSHENNAQIGVEDNLHINNPSISYQIYPCGHRLLNLQPFNGWSVNYLNHYPLPSSMSASRAPKRKVELDNVEQEFKNINKLI